MSAASPATPVAVTPSDSPVTALDVALFIVTVLSWSLSWYALALQAQAEISIQTSLMWRFVIASAMMFGWAKLAGKRLAFPARDHMRFAVLGLFIFCLNFMLFYYGSRFLISGLLSVVFSLASVVNLAFAFFAQKRVPKGRVAIGAICGVVGIALMFAPEIAGQEWSWRPALGLALCFGGTLSFCCGNQVSAKLQASKIPVISASAWGMAYGATASALMALGLGASLAPIAEPVWLGSLVFLAVISTVVAFWAYLTLLGRIGASRAGYATVVFPVLALLLSGALEGYQFGLAALAGLVLVLAGNVLVLRG